MKGVTVGDVNINGNRFDDDTVFLAESEENLQPLLNIGIDTVIEEC